MPIPVSRHSKAIYLQIWIFVMGLRLCRYVFLSEHKYLSLNLAMDEFCTTVVSKLGLYSPHEQTPGTLFLAWWISFCKCHFCHVRKSTLRSHTKIHMADVPCLWCCNREKIMFRRHAQNISYHIIYQHCVCRKQKIFLQERCVNLLLSSRISSVKYRHELRLFIYWCTMYISSVFGKIF